jgi:hypothetical protein
MFKITEEVLDFHTMSNEISYNCPCCDERGEYYAWPPEVCDNCGFHLERLLLMEADIDDKIEYYREGEL